MEENQKEQQPLTDEQKIVVDEALEIYYRLHMGQIPFILNLLEVSPITKELSFLEMLGIKNKLEEIQERITGSRYGGPGINSNRVSDKARVARNLQEQFKEKPPVLQKVHVRVWERKRYKKR